MVHSHQIHGLKHHQIHGEETRLEIDGKKVVEI